MPARTKAKFERANVETANNRDEVGTVQILVRLFKDGNYVKGNRSRSLRVANAKVSDVVRHIEDALFED